MEYDRDKEGLVFVALLGAVYLQFGDGSVLKLPSALNAFQGQLIELLRFPPPAVYLRPQEVES